MGLTQHTAFGLRGVCRSVYSRAVATHTCTHGCSEATLNMKFVLTA
jgi:hypothetical protein